MVVGTGLLLSVCRDIIHEHQGAIHLLDLPEPGATFRVELPVGKPSRQAGTDGQIGGVGVDRRLRPLARLSLRHGRASADDTPAR